MDQYLDNILMQGFYDKCIIAAQNASAFCSAYTGETINYTTVKRGYTIWTHAVLWLLLFVLRFSDNIPESLEHFCLCTAWSSCKY